MSKDLGQAYTMHDLPRISTVIPTYNRAHLISRAISSALNQTRPADEIIVVDDGSNDNTQDVVSEFGDQVRYVLQKNAGSAVARHTGFLAAQSEWVALLDSDDIWKPDHLERISEAILATGGCANYYFTDLLRDKRDDYKTQWQLAGFSLDKPYVLFDPGSNLLLFGKKKIALQATVINKSAYMAVGGFMKELRYHDDTHICIKLGLKDPICAVSGGEAVMMDDDQAVNRLSTNYDSSKQGYKMKISMCMDITEHFDTQLTSDERSVFSEKISGSYLGIAKLSWRERAYIESLRNLTLSVASSPRAFFNRRKRNLHG